MARRIHDHFFKLHVPSLPISSFLFLVRIKRTFRKPFYHIFLPIGPLPLTFWDHFQIYLMIIGLLLILRHFEVQFIHYVELSAILRFWCMEYVLNRGFFHPSGAGRGQSVCV